MSLNSIIINTLAPLGVPVAFQMYSKSAPTYITFFEFNQNGALHADDREVKTAHSVQIDICSKVDYTDLVEQVKDKLSEVGFIRIMETDLFETETKTYRKVLRFNYVQ